MSERAAPSVIGRTSGQRIPIFIESRILQRIDEILPGPPGKLPLEIVTDRTVDAILGSRVALCLRQAGWKVHRTVLSAGEKTKNARTIARLHEEWFERGYDRQTPILALGGGVIGDAAGFAAATFMRGLPFWQVPTTVLAQVDAAIGGKVGINHSRGKNLVGAFYQPRGIIIDPGILSTLSTRERRSGLAEVAKYGVIADPRLFRSCERCLADWVAGETPIPSDVIRRCVRIKVQVVAADERESGLRRILNFGHTLGHAFERWADYRRLRHGEAVALGMVGASWMAAQRGSISQAQLERIADLCALLRPTRGIGKFKHAEITRHLAVDKKRTHGRNVWVLPEALGQVYVTDDITDKEVRGALRHVEEWMD